MTTFRPARAIDAPEIIDLLAGHYVASRFADRGEIDRPYARKLFAQASCRHGHTNDGGTWFEVMEGDRGIEAFILGALQRAYLIGDKLAAQDMFFIARPDADQRATLQLLDHYVAWARDNPRCIEVMGTWTDVLPGAERIEAVYRRKGFTHCGGVYRMWTDAGTMKEAA